MIHPYGFIVRTTIDLPDDLLAELKKRAAGSHRTLESVIQDGLRQAVARRVTGRQLGPVRLTTYGAGGLQPGVDLDDGRALRDVMS